MLEYFFGFVIFGLVQTLPESDVKIRRIGKKFIEEQFYPLMFANIPNVTAQMNYDNVRLVGGTMMTYEEVKNMPKIRYLGRWDNFHTVLMARPVIPADGDPSKYQEFDHWIVGNIPGSKIKKGDVIIPYNISRLPEDIDELYPYVFAVFEQPGKLSFTNEIFNDTLKRVNGCVRLKQFVSKYDLIGPTSANYFILCD